MRKDSDSRWAYYDTFAVGPLSDKYRLTVSGYDPGSSVNDDFSYNSGMQWSTIDHDNDLNQWNCPDHNGGPWWFKDCWDVGTGLLN